MRSRFCIIQRTNYTMLIAKKIMYMHGSRNPPPPGGEKDSEGNSFFGQAGRAYFRGKLTTCT